ncbi:hypothetical protein [Paenibacillus amylolyticus]|uniref:hypothetical protein n=1 Tax=Paenibacillus amylolyticus TaxID=1451 RepID=UPI003D96783F
MNRRGYIIIAVILILTPILINILARIVLPFNISFITPVGEPKDWVAFFGTYMGAIIGGIIAFIVARLQIRSNEKENNRIRTLEKRMYVNYNILTADLNFKNNLTHNYRLLVTNSFKGVRSDIKVIEKRFKEKTHNNEGRIHLTDFLQFRIIGESNLVFNVEIIVNFKKSYPTNYEIEPINKMEFTLLHLTIDEILLIPTVYKANLNYTHPQQRVIHDDLFDIKNIEFHYTTVMNEKIGYIIDFANKKHLYRIYNDDGSFEPMNEMNLTNTSWEYLDREM